MKQFKVERTPKDKLNKSRQMKQPKAAMSKKSVSKVK